jgi:hypothetical protein
MDINGSVRDSLHEIEHVFSSTSPFKVTVMFHPIKDNGRLFHGQVILYGLDPLDAPCDLTRLVDGLLRINETTQLNGAPVSFDTDPE